ncbi:methyltransferase, FxLD system [Glycomyces sp. NRRL B-16210]|uniref:methyltransferase, FxLD system n=1 Tax=Glycomyces sp. NRRL B-16210 TaxID=1463821 RepID=UPI001414E074|nr:methyltransferase, FxLD system [Glycomyces sp. NRRL B-16210]
MTNDETNAAALRATLADRVERDFPHLNAETLEVVRQVPRHAFVPDVDLEAAYVDDAVVTRRDEHGRALSSISQPSMVAQMLDLLDLAPGHRVLEIGAGTGYCAALIAELVGPSGAVTTIDLDPEITDEAHRNLDATGYSRVTVTCADGALGDPEGAPWDRIIVSVGSWEPAPEWIAQLAPGGKLVMPLSLGAVQRIVAFALTDYGLRSVTVLAGGFLAQRGRDARPRTIEVVDETISIESPHGLGQEARTILDRLAGEPVPVWTGVVLPPPGRFDRLLIFLALHHQGMFTLTAPRDFLPGALRAWNVIYAIEYEGTIAHLALRPSAAADHHEVGVLAYGPEAASVATLLADDVRSWERLRELDPVFTVYPRTPETDRADLGPVVLDKQHSRIRVTWPAAGPEPIAMHLHEEYFDLIASGQKTVEVRCADVKRLAVQPGSHIRFTSGGRMLTVVVVRVARYDTFAALYASEDAAAINPHRNRAEQLAGIEALYTPEKRALGAVAIAIKRIGAETKH